VEFPRATPDTRWQLGKVVMENDLEREKNDHIEADPCSPGPSPLMGQHAGVEHAGPRRTAPLPAPTNPDSLEAP